MKWGGVGWGGVGWGGVGWGGVKGNYFYCFHYLSQMNSNVFKVFRNPVNLLI